MSRSVFLTGAAFAAIGLFAWFLWFASPEPREVVRDVHALDRTRVRSPAASASAEVTAVAATEPDAAIAIAEPIEAGANTRVEVAQARLEEGGVELHVVGPDGGPVQGAEVFVISGADEETLESFYDTGAIDELMETRGLPHLTDASGTLNVPAPGEQPTLILARRGDLWGSRTLRAERDDDDEPIELALELDVTLRARVVTEDGTPVPGIAVELTQKDSWGSWAAQRAVAEGDEALAILRHVQEHIDDDSDDDSEGWAVRLDALFEHAIEHGLDPASLPQEIVTLALPPTGFVEVHVYGDDRAPFAGAGTVSLAIVRAGEPKQLSPFHQAQRRSVEQPVVDGVALFPFVEPGRQLAIAVTRASASVPTRAYGSSAARAGETASFHVRLGSDHPVALLRAVDERGRPIADTELSVRVVVGTGFSKGTTLQTEADGSFYVDLDSNWAEGTQRELLVTRGSPDEPDAAGRVDASRRLQDGTNDLGQVRLEPAPLFVRGQVVSSTGEAIADAKLLLQSRTGESSHWRPDWTFEHRSGADGRFEVRGIRAGEEFRVGASHAGHAGPMVGFTPGDSNVLIELHAEGTLEGVVLLDPDLPREELELRITGDVAHLEYQERRASIDDDGRFRFSRLLRGEYAVKVRFDSHQGTIETIAEIRVMDGVTNRDPRLDPLDLRGIYWAHRVTITLPDGMERAQGDARFGEPGAEELKGRRWLYEPEFWLLARHEYIDLVIAVAGCRPERLESVGGEIEVTLTAGRKVRLALGSDVPIPEPPLYIKVVLMVDDNYSAVDWGAAAFDEDREVTIDAPGSGEMQVLWIVERRSSGSTSAWTVNFESPQLVEVADVLDQRIEVTLTEEQVEKLFEDR